MPEQALPSREEIFSKPNILSPFNVNYYNFARDLNSETESSENEFDFAMIELQCRISVINF